MGRFARTAAVSIAVCLGTAGCFQVVIAGASLSQISTVATVASIAVTGKGLGEHGLDLVTGKDCRILEGLLRDERELCEDRDSVATQDDFRGVLVWLDEQLDETPRPARPVLTATPRQRDGGPIGKVARFAGLETGIEPRRAEPPSLLADLARQPAAEREAPTPAPAVGREAASLGTRLGLGAGIEAAQVRDALDDGKPEVAYLDVVPPLKLAAAGRLDLGLRLGGMPGGPALRPLASARPVLATGLPVTQ